MDQYNTVRGTAATSHIRDAQPRETPTRADDTGLPSEVRTLAVAWFGGFQTNTEAELDLRTYTVDDLEELCRERASRELVARLEVPQCFGDDAEGKQVKSRFTSEKHKGACAAFATFGDYRKLKPDGKLSSLRIAENVKTLGAYVIDLDIRNMGDLSVVDDVRKRLEPWRAWAWTTWSHEWVYYAAWRFVIPFTVDVDADLWSHVWEELNQLLAAGRNDNATKPTPQQHCLPRAPGRIKLRDGNVVDNRIEWWSSGATKPLFDPTNVVDNAKRKQLLNPDEVKKAGQLGLRDTQTKRSAEEAAAAFALLDAETRERIREAAKARVTKEIERLRTPPEELGSRRKHIFVCGCRIGGHSGFSDDAEKFVEEMVQLTLQTALAMGVPDAGDHERQVRNGVDKGKLDHEPVEKLVMKTAKKGDKQRAATKNEVLALVDIDGLVYDEYLEASYLQDGVVPPWNAARHGPRKLDDQDAVDVTLWIEAAKNLRCDENLAGRMLWRAAKDHPVDRLREYLLAPRWDGIQRLDTWLSVYLGADDNGYNALVGRKWMIQAVARALKPGCKADNVLVLEGKQGAQKSTALSVLGGGGQFFNDQLPDNLGDKDASLAMNGTWIVEMADLHSLSKTRVTMLKAFITRQVDRFRPPYGKNLIDTPRRSVLAGTTNEKGYLVDETGNRRFWPVACGEEPEGHPFIAQRMQALRDDVTMLWAEAVAAYDAGEAWWLTTEAQVNLAKGMQEERIVEHPLALWLERALAGQEWKKKCSPVVQLTMDDALGLAYEMNDPNHRKDSKAVAALLQKNGFRRVRGTTKTGERPWVYVKDGYSFCDRHSAVFGYGKLTLLEYNAYNAALEETFFAETKRGVDALAELAGNPVP